MNTLRKIERAAVEIVSICIELEEGQTGSREEIYKNALLAYYDDLNAAMIEYETGQAPTPLPSRTPLTDAWANPTAEGLEQAHSVLDPLFRAFGPGIFDRPENNDGVSDENDLQGYTRDDLDTLHERDIGPRD